MPVGRSPNNKEIPVNIVGSSVFGRYPKIDIEKTYNMFISDGFLVPYAGYKIIIPSNLLDNGLEGRGIFTSTKFEGLFVVTDNNVWIVRLQYDQLTQKVINQQIIPIGQLQTNSGPVYIVENNKPQILISDNVDLYIYDPTIGPDVQLVPDLNFKPGYITFHDTYFICAASFDMTYNPPANNTWRLSLQNE